LELHRNRNRRAGAPTGRRVAGGAALLFRPQLCRALQRACRPPGHNRLWRRALHVHFRARQSRGRPVPSGEEPPLRHVPAAQFLTLGAGMNAAADTAKARRIRPRVIPLLLLSDALLYKTVRFRNPKYVGDPRVAVKIFSDKGADELILLDIRKTGEG